jgi:hypothetical protein
MRLNHCQVRDKKKISNSGFFEDRGIHNTGGLIDTRVLFFLSQQLSFARHKLHHSSKARRRANLSFKENAALNAAFPLKQNLGQPPGG